ncbi:MAG: head-tail adaptor protein [Lachnospiraceae bacterium]
MRRKSQKFETFNDGILDICKASGRTLIETKAAGVRYGNKTVGVKRYWEAQVSGNNISRMVSVLYIPDIERDDIILVKGRQYRISQVQEKFDAKPPCLYLSLESIQIPYKDERTM